MGDGSELHSEKEVCNVENKLSSNRGIISKNSCSFSIIKILLKFFIDM